MSSGCARLMDLGMHVIADLLPRDHYNSSHTKVRDDKGPSIACHNHQSVDMRARRRPTLSATLIQATIVGKQQISNTPNIVCGTNLEFCCTFQANDLDLWWSAIEQCDICQQGRLCNYCVMWCITLRLEQRVVLAARLMPSQQKAPG
eukprot:2891479-Amphidinium_carterae.1